MVKMGEFVIAAYRPNKGNERELLKELKQHMPILRSEGLITDRPSYTLRSQPNRIGVMGSAVPGVVLCTICRAFFAFRPSTSSV